MKVIAALAVAAVIASTSMALEPSEKMLTLLSEVNGCDASNGDVAISLDTNVVFDQSESIDNTTYRLQVSPCRRTNFSGFCQSAFIAVDSIDYSYCYGNASDAVLNLAGDGLTRTYELTQSDAREPNLLHFVQVQYRCNHSAVNLTYTGADIVPGTMFVYFDTQLACPTYNGDGTATCDANVGELSVTLDATAEFNEPEIVNGTGYQIWVSPCRRANLTGYCESAYIQVDSIDYSYCYGNASAAVLNAAGNVTTLTYELTRSDAREPNLLHFVQVQYRCNQSAINLTYAGGESVPGTMFLYFDTASACATTNKGNDGHGSDDSKSKQIAAGIAIGVVAAIFLVLGVVIFMFRRAATSNAATYNPI